MLGDAYHLHVKHATKDEWRTVGPNPTHYGFWQSLREVTEMSEFFRSIGHETRIEPFQIEYDNR